MSRCRIPALAALLLVVLCHHGPAWADEREQEEGPRLILPGSLAVHPGQEIVLAWTSDDDVSELEILLSLDGGHTYPIWISPRLSPRDRRFVWRVPDSGGGSLRMRIRFNRGGREIEGAPTASLDVVPAGTPEPLGLPPVSADPERAPRPGADNASSRACAWPALAGRLRPPRRAFRQLPPETATALSTAEPSRGAGPPRFVPLRA